MQFNFKKLTIYERGSNIVQWLRSCSTEHDELLWGATWLYKATENRIYLNYVLSNVYKMGRPWNIGEFGWDSKVAGISYDILIQFYMFYPPLLNQISHTIIHMFWMFHLFTRPVFNKVDWKPFVSYADEFVCSVIPESSNPSIKYTPGGLIYKPNMNNLQIASSLS